MIRFKIQHNLDDVIDYINSMQNDIESIVAEGTQQAYEDLKNDIPYTFGNAMQDSVIEFDNNGGNFVISVKGVNEYHLYNATGDTPSTVEDFMVEAIQNRIKQSFENRGYNYGY